ncbi:hypothetical protein J6590_025657, partial [Homalodisca vitripennis]
MNMRDAKRMFSLNACIATEQRNALSDIKIAASVPPLAAQSERAHKCHSGTSWLFHALATGTQFFHLTMDISGRTGYSGWVRLGVGPPPIEIHYEEEFNALISSHVPSKEGEASSETASPVKGDMG